MPGCGEPAPGGLPDGTIDPTAIPYNGPFPDTQEETGSPFVRDLTVPELEEIIEKCVRRVLQGEDIKREWAKLQAARKK